MSIILATFAGAVAGGLIGGGIGAVGARQATLLMWIGVTFGWDGLRRYLSTGSPVDKASQS